ncbi:hypothetical protein P154DRAFT_532681 [Amniculicola lignicola CBS 123094]|uniref:Uncharacterized protein n=1 Tax=Amniculicola lignicola CBS 123094 TaxID=1392246 RepID=A0A6A5WRI6_9PLEO|nr:hypothetical protein P154DRAFT_532681 [Amniculicola lignicola CBS 123094]
MPLFVAVPLGPLRIHCRGLQGVLEDDIFNIGMTFEALFPDVKMRISIEIFTSYDPGMAKYSSTQNKLEFDLGRVMKMKGKEGIVVFEVLHKGLGNIREDAFLLNLRSIGRVFRALKAKGLDMRLVYVYRVRRLSFQFLSDVWTWSAEDWSQYLGKYDLGEEAYDEVVSFCDTIRESFFGTGVRE